MIGEPSRSRPPSALVLLRPPHAQHPLQIAVVDMAQRGVAGAVYHTRPEARALDAPPALRRLLPEGPSSWRCMSYGGATPRAAVHPSIFGGAMPETAMPVVEDWGTP